jgi:uncharacterized protein YjbI with pentapeptide repeats
MPEEKIISEELCKYKSGNEPTYHCHERPLEYSKQGLCIFHEPEKKEEDYERFEKAIDQQIKGGTYQFIGYVFPKPVNFSKRKFIDADFSDSTFMMDVDFSESTFADFVAFSGSTFYGKADFTQSSFKEGAWFDRSTFNNDAYFWGITFVAAHFDYATFIKEADFSYSTFNDQAVFDYSTFNGFTNFYESTFNDSVKFNCSTFNDRVNFDYTFFKGHVGAHNAKLKDNYSAGVLFRNAKNSSYMAGNLIYQGYYHQQEMDAIRKAQKWFPRWWNFLFQKLLHGYGERPFNVFISALSVIFISALFFSKFGIQELSSPGIVKNLWTCLYYSVVTFTTLGYGDIRPVGVTRVFAAVEALTGAFLMALFVVTFARRWKR